jgi:hypothetical protein
LRRYINAIFNAGWIHEVSLQVRDALKEYRFMSHRDVIEQDQVLMNLPHIADVWNYLQSELSRQQAHREKL